MAGSVINNAMSTLLQAQTASTQAKLPTQKSAEPAAAQTIIEQARDGKNHAKGSNQLSATLASAAPPPSSLPRGSLVDITV